VLLSRAGVAYNGFFSHWAKPSDPVGVALMREGLASLPTDDVATRAQVTSMLANAMIVAPGDEALQLAPESEALARQAGDQDAQLRALLAWSWALRGRARSDELCTTALRGAQLAASMGRITYEGACRYLLGTGLIEQGKLAEARAEFEHPVHRQTAMGGWYIPVFGATIAAASGRFDEAAQLADRAHEHGTPIGSTNDTIFMGHKVQIAYHRGDIEGGLDAVQRSLTTAFPLLWWEAVLLIEQGDLEGARRASESYERDIAPLLPWIVSYIALNPRAVAAFELGDRALARRVGDDLAGFEGTLLASDTYIEGAADQALGLIALAEGEHDRAVTLLDRSLATDEHHGFHALAAHHRLDLARALFARAQPGDSDRAAEVLRTATEAAAGLGMPLVERRAHKLLAG
jgi:tetratricopeptide (TPR) repeat protein